MRTCGRTGRSGGLTKKTEVNRCPDGTRFPPGEMWDGLADIARIFQISPCGKLVLLIEVTVEIDGLPQAVAMFQHRVPPWLVRPLRLCFLAVHHDEHEDASRETLLDPARRIAARPVE